jgi:ATP-binding cassette subfamily B protein
VLSVLAAVATLAQPLVVGQVIDRVQKRPARLLVWVLVGSSSPPR